MTTTVKQNEYRAPNGNTLRHVSRPVKPIDADALIKERDAWYEENKHFLEGYSVEKFLEEKHHDVEKGLL